MKNFILTLVVALAILFIFVSNTTEKQDKGEKITICHIPPGNPENAHTIRVSINALEAHLNHGDSIGSCDNGGGDQ